MEQPALARLAWACLGSPDRPPAPADELAELFARLDALLLPALRAMQGNGEADPVLGAYISERQVERLIAEPPGTGPLWRLAGEPRAALPGLVRPDARLRRLGDAFGLDDTDLGLVTVALAPEFDDRYERLYAYLQDDATRRWPSVGLALDLLAGSASEKLDARRHVAAAEAPLVRHRLVRIHEAEPGQALLSCRLALDRQVVDFLLGHDGLDQRLTPFAEVVAPEPATSPPDEREARLLALVGAADQRPPLLHFHGGPGAGKRTAAMRLAAGTPLLYVDLTRAPADDAGFDAAFSLVAARCRLHPCLLYLDHVDLIPDAPEGARWRAVATILAAHRGTTVLASPKPLAAVRRGSLRAVEVAFAAPGVAERRRLWRERLAEAGLRAGDDELDRVAELFELTPGRIGDAVNAVAGALAWRTAGGAGDGGGPALFAAARAQAGEVLAGLADRLEQPWGWDDIVLPADAIAQLKGICRRVLHQRQVLDGWGMGRKLPLGRGVAALFAGPSGTGKTMAAAIVGRELGLDVYRIDLSRVVNKYIGETEKNLARVFDAALQANVALFFDEAEALFGKRSEVRDAHDRYANIEIGYLLQRMEAYPGTTILATNLRHHLDEAFLRRLQVVVEFPMPGEADRLRLWRRMFPPEAPLAADVDLEALAREVRLAGGHIRNVALAAAFAAAGAGRPIALGDLWLAAAREHRKLGRPWQREATA